MNVLFVITEHSSFLDPPAVDRYEDAARRLEDAAGTAVESVHYEEARDLGGAGAVILSGSSAPWAAHDRRALERLGEVARAYDGPVLGICAGMQLQAVFAGGSIRHAVTPPETGYAAIDVLDDADLLRGLPSHARVYQRHTDEIDELPDEFRVLARSEACPVEAIASPARRWWGTQFHPELTSPEHPDGARVLRNFFELAGLRS